MLLAIYNWIYLYAATQPPATPPHLLSADTPRLPKALTLPQLFDVEQSPLVPLLSSSTAPATGEPLQTQQHGILNFSSYEINNRTAIIAPGL